MGLASFTMRAQRALDRLSQLPGFCEFKWSYVRSLGEPSATAAALHGELHPLLGEFDCFLPGMPPGAYGYFSDLRSLVAEAVTLTERWWAVSESMKSAAPG